MTKRELILENIRVEVATHGYVTQTCWRLYVENRISRAAFNRATATGTAQYRKANA